MTITEDKQARRANGPGSGGWSSQGWVQSRRSAIRPRTPGRPSWPDAPASTESPASMSPSIPRRSRRRSRGSTRPHISRPRKRGAWRCSQLAVVAARGRGGCRHRLGAGGPRACGRHPGHGHGRHGYPHRADWPLRQRRHGARHAVRGAGTPGKHAGVSRGHRARLPGHPLDHRDRVRGDAGHRRGLELIRRKTDIVLAGGTESQVNMLFFTGFSAMRVLSAQRRPAGREPPLRRTARRLRHR